MTPVIEALEATIAEGKKLAGQICAGDYNLQERSKVQNALGKLRSLRDELAKE